MPPPMRISDVVRALSQQQASESVEIARELVKLEEDLSNIRQAIKGGLDDMEWANSELARLKARRVIARQSSYDRAGAGNTPVRSRPGGGMPPALRGGLRPGHE